MPLRCVALRCVALRNYLSSAWPCQPLFIIFMYNFFVIYINSILPHFFYSYKWFYYIFLQKSSEYPYLTLLFGNFRLLLFFALSFLMLLQNIICIFAFCNLTYTNIGLISVLFIPTLQDRKFANAPALLQCSLDVIHNQPPTSKVHICRIYGEK